MSLVNNRVYGSDIPSKVKKILEARQHAAERKVNPEEEIESNYATGDNLNLENFYLMILLEKPS